MATQCIDAIVTDDGGDDDGIVIDANTLILIAAGIGIGYMAVQTLGS